MKKYNKYKDSGIEWIGEIPEHWEVKKLKFFADVVLGKMLTPDDKGNYELKAYLRAKNIEWTKPNVEDVKEMWFSESELNQYRVRKSDLLVSEGGEVGRTCIWNDEIEECYIQNSVHKVSLLNNCNSIYFLNQFVLFGSKGHFDAIVNKISIAHLTKEKLKDISFVYPPLDEQHSIATYLDRKTAQIDDLISKKEKLIELLKEERAAMINQAVTKGLDNNVPMKDSGIEWLGEIPEGWEVKPLKHICNIQGRVGYKGYTISDLVEKGEGPYTLGAKHINKMNQLDLSQPEFISWEKYYESPEIMVFQNDLLLTQRGTLGKVVLIEENIGEATINPSMVLLNKLKANGKFLYYFFCSEYFTKWIDLTNTATAVPMISQQQLGNFKLTIPPEREQISIIEYLYEKQQIFNELTLRISNQVALLKEYKTALISEVVTGKLKVIED